MMVVFWIECSLVLAVWVVSERMIFGEVARVCRDAGLRRHTKVRAVITAVADIPLACSSVYACFLMATVIRTPNGYCFHFCEYSKLALEALLALPLMLVFAPIWGLLAGLVSALWFLGFLGAIGKIGILYVVVFAFSSVYLLLGPFLRGKIMWGAPGRSKWWAAFVFSVTYWPHMLLSFILMIAEETANATGGMHCDLPL